MGLLIPLYTYPADLSWSAVKAQKQFNPSADITVIMNPNNGVGTSSDANYINGVRHMQLSGITVLGYVATGYGARQMDSIIAECARYAAWYSVDGIFFDELQSGWQAPPVLGVSVGNPGTDATSNIPLVTYESAGMPPTGFQGNYIAHTVAALPATYPKPTFYYITDDPATYQRLPSYFAQLVAQDASTTNPPSPPPSPPRTLTLMTPSGTYTWTVQ